MAETKSTETQTTTPTAAPTGSVSEHVAKFATFISKDTYEAVSKKVARNTAILTFLEDSLYGIMKLANPSITPDTNKFKFDTTAQYQFLVLVRMMYISAINGKLSDETEIKTAASNFADGTVESNLWRWLTGVLAHRGETWENQRRVSPSDPVGAITAFYKKVDESSSAGDFVEIVLENLITKICAQILHICGPEVDISAKKTITVNATLFNGILRQLNESSKPVATSFFIDLYHCAEQYPNTKKFWDAQNKTAKPKAAKAPKKK